MDENEEKAEKIKNRQFELCTTCAESIIEKIRKVNTECSDEEYKELVKNTAEEIHAVMTIGTLMIAFAN